MYRYPLDKAPRFTNLKGPGARRASLTYAVDAVDCSPAHHDMRTTLARGH